MRKHNNIQDYLSGTLLFLGILSLVLAFSMPRNPGDTTRAARQAQRAISERVEIMDACMAKALEQAPNEWLDIAKVPDDIVIYRYYNDTLQSWVHSFPQINDNIRPRPDFQNMASLRANPVLPLADIGEELSFVNMGSKWYLAKSYSQTGLRIIAALEIINRSDSRYLNGVNPRLRIGEKYTLRPLSEDGGSVVEIEGVPQFKISYESLSGSSSADPIYLCLAISLLIASALVFLLVKRSIKRFVIVTLGFLALMGMTYTWGRFAQWDLVLFSPTLYAGGSVLYSLGAVIIINLTILFLSIFVLLAKDDLIAKMRTDKKIKYYYLIGAFAVLGILSYTHTAIKSIVLNSSITLELFKMNELSVYTGVVYASFMTMLLSIPMLLQLLLPRSKGFDVLSRAGRLFFAAFIAIYLVGITSLLGFDKEKKRVEMWANRIAFDRDISLEMRLENMEQSIADDAIISTLSVFNNMEQTIQSRLSNEYFFRIDQGYELKVFILNRFTNTPRNLEYFNSQTRGAEPISDNSRFLYVNSNGGRSYYAGVFTYSVQGHGLSTVLITISSTVRNEIRGYAAIFGMAPPGRVVIPTNYSYARYEEASLRSYKGSYAYPTSLDEDYFKRVYYDRPASLKEEGYTHFINTINEGEAVIISRPSHNAANYVIPTILIGLLFFFLLSLLKIPQSWPRVPVFRKQYYKSMISVVLLISLTSTLVAMTLASVFFVINRNESNRASILSDRVNSISIMIESGSKGLHSERDLMSPDFMNLIQSVSANINSDITVFALSGRVLSSTSALAFERASVGSRIDGEAYHNIVHNSRRYYLTKDKVGGQSFNSIYIPIKNTEGRLLGILCSPYTEENYDFEKDAVSHSVTIIAVFLILLILAKMSAEAVIDKMFAPLSEMSQKMSVASLDSLEPVQYDRNDEILALVNAYNLMVAQLAENSKKLAQAERDKAWSGMARQVAHEIKNPLTPMKLQIQRIIRLKAKGDPSWQDKFDEVTRVLLDHIDILTDTANEFSSFAKLYTEDPTDINLDRVLQEEISMFDNKGNVQFEYIGLSDTVVQGPKPQLTRVFVNLINNAVQAVGDAPNARVFVALRKSTIDGYYDIVVEDNGPGVSEENISKLFTPNFTTKNGGSGLGLAISRSILERCGAKIFYSKSFALGGACFTIQYPINTIYTARTDA